MVPEAFQDASRKLPGCFQDDSRRLLECFQTPLRSPDSKALSSAPRMIPTNQDSRSNDRSKQSHKLRSMPRTKSPDKLKAKFQDKPTTFKIWPRPPRDNPRPPTGNPTPPTGNPNAKFSNKLSPQIWCKIWGQICGQIWPGQN